MCDCDASVFFLDFDWIFEGPIFEGLAPGDVELFLAKIAEEAEDIDIFLYGYLS